MFRRQLAARWQVVAGVAAVVLICAGCGTTTAPAALGTRTHGPILNLVTARSLSGGRPRGLTQYFAVKTRTVYAAAFLGDLHGATQLVMTWSRLTAKGLQVLFSKEVPVSSYGIAYTTGVTPGTLPLGTYQVSASVDGVTRSEYWTVFTPPHATADVFAKSAAPPRLGESGSFPQFIPKIPCDQVQNAASMPGTTDVRLVLSAFCPQDHRNGPTRGAVVATMNRNTGEWLVGSLHLLHTGMLTGSFSLNVCKLPGGSNRPGAVLYYTSIVYYRGVSRNFSGKYVLPPAHLAPVVIISSSVPADAVVYPGEKIVLHVTGAEPIAFGPEVPVRSVIVTGPGGKLVKQIRFGRAPRGCDVSRLRKTITATYTVPAGVRGTLTLTAQALGVPGHPGKATISFRAGS